MNKLHKQEAYNLARKTIKQALRMNCDEYSDEGIKDVTEAHKRAT